MTDFGKKFSQRLCIVAEDAENEVVEAYYSKKHKLLGIQWHPEKRIC